MQRIPSTSIVAEVLEIKNVPCISWIWTRFVFRLEPLLGSDRAAQKVNTHVESGQSDTIIIILLLFYQGKVQISVTICIPFSSQHHLEIQLDIDWKARWSEDLLLWKQNGLSYHKTADSVLFFVNFKS